MAVEPAVREDVLRNFPATGSYVVNGLSREIMCQGRLLLAKVSGQDFRHLGGERGIIRWFSRASRIRMMQRLAALDPECIGTPKFISLTVPDDVVPACYGDVTRWRSNFWKTIERTYGHTPAVWRIEWKPRLTGKRVGTTYPHIHLIAFRNTYLHYSDVNAAWKHALSWTAYCRTETKPIKTPQMLGRYVSKYMSKVCSGSLVVPAYLAGGIGRQWGIHRPGLMPWAEVTRFSCPLDATWQTVLEMARAAFPGVTENPDRSFWLMGDAVPAIENYLLWRHWS